MWQNQFLEEHAKCGSDLSCIDKVRSKCLKHGQYILGQDEKVSQFKHCLFPTTDLKDLNIVGPKKSCRKLKYKSEIRHCLVKKEAKCKVDLKASRPSWGKKKVANKCKIRVRIEACVIRRWLKVKKNRRPQRRWWDRKKARGGCRKRIMSSSIAKKKL